jgi:hypothetical protein
MELTEDTMRIIAMNIADLRLRLDLLQRVVIREGPVAEGFDKLVEQTRETPEFQEICDEILEQLKGDL